VITTAHFGMLFQLELMEPKGVSQMWRNYWGSAGCGSLWQEKERG